MRILRLSKCERIALLPLDFLVTDWHGRVLRFGTQNTGPGFNVFLFENRSTRACPSGFWSKLPSDSS